MKCLYMRLRSHKKPLLRLVGMKKKKTENFELGQIEELALISKSAKDAMRFQRRLFRG